MYTAHLVMGGVLSVNNDNRIFVLSTNVVLQPKSSGISRLKGLFLACPQCPGSNSLLQKKFTSQGCRKQIKSGEAISIVFPCSVRALHAQTRGVWKSFAF